MFFSHTEYKVTEKNCQHVFIRVSRQCLVYCINEKKFNPQSLTIFSCLKKNFRELIKIMKINKKCM